LKFPKMLKFLDHHVFHVVMRCGTIGRSVDLRTLCWSITLIAMRSSTKWLPPTIRQACLRRGIMHIFPPSLYSFQSWNDRLQFNAFVDGVEWSCGSLCAS
jgi:hypothetical protein